RGDGGRGEASRQSRRVQGFGPEEHKDLETVVRDAQKAKRAARESEVAQGRDVEASAAQHQSAAGSQTPEEQVSPGSQGSSEANSGSQTPEVPEEHTREGGAQASEGGANAVEPPEVIDLVSSSDESVVEVKPEPVRVKEEAKTLSSKVNSGFAPPEPRVSAPSSQVKPERDAREAAAPVPESKTTASDIEGMVLYIRREVRRWEEANPGKVTPPSVVYEWPTPKPDANSYFAAAYATGDYFKWRLSLVNQDEAWISEFHVARWGVGTAQDLMATTIPQSIMTARECVAILQTLFFEAGFEFVNLISGWSATRASRIPESLVRSVMEEVQNFIAVGLVEWRVVTTGVPFKVNSEDHAAPSVQEQVPRLEYHKEDGDLLMTDYNADLLGHQFVLRFRQEWQARMEQEQREFLARERLDALERERLREQRDLDARRQIQELTDRLVHAEITRRDAERRMQDVEARQTQNLTETQGATQSVMEAVRLERERLDANYPERWQQREAEADAERARWASEVHTSWKEQMSTMKQKVQELEAERERERESSQNVQRFHAGQVRDLRATLAQVQGRRTTVTPDLATNLRSSVAQNPEIATRSQGSSGVIGGNATVADQRQGTADLRNTPEVAASQRKATFVQSSADISGRAKHAKRGHGALETKVMQDVKSEPVDSKRSVAKKHRQEKKKRRDVNPPSDSDPSSDSSDDDSSSKSSDDSSDENPGVNLTAASATQAGTTLLTFRPYINSNTLGEFDTKASLRERMHWWERFANMAAQGGWSTKMRIQELKLKLPGAARDWFNQLPKHTQRDWRELASAFRKKYCKARSSYSERYFTMEMKNSESALNFFYRLNSAAGKADIDFRKSSKRLEKHIRRFITKLRDTRLKTSLQGQRFRNIADLEYVSRSR
ncbi:Hypothetical protein PHPALM_12734, partial [Phytophthora palmivora]